MPLASEPRLARCFDALDRNRDFTAENFHTISTDTHIDDMVILPIIQPGGANENATGTVHFQALLDQNLLLAGSNAVRDHPRGTASGGGSGGGIVSVVKNHASVEAGLGIDGFAANKVKEFSATRREIFGGAVEIEAQLLQRRQRAQRDNGKRNAGGDSLDGRGVVEISALRPVRRAMSSTLWMAPNSGSFCVISPKMGCAGSWVKRTGTVPTFRSSRISGAPRARRPRENKSGAERWMSGKGQFFLDGEDAHAHSPGLFGSGVPRKNEGSFGKIHFARQRLHGFGAEAASIEEHRQRVAGEGAVGKHIDLHHGELSCRSSHA